MTTLILETEPLATQVTVSDQKLIVDLVDGRSLTVPLAWYPRLLNASPEERQTWQLLGDGYAIEWTNVEDHHPTPQEVFWIIEIAASSLRFDCEVKALAYAQPAIPEYWVLDVNEFKLHVYRSPSANGYQSEMILAEEMTIAPLVFSSCLVTVKEMLRSSPNP